MAGEAVDGVILTAVRLVSDHHDVAPVGQEGMPVSLLFGEELLDGGEHHSTRCDRKPGAQVGPALGLNRRLPQQVPATGESTEELIVKIVAVGQHDDGGVFHRRFANDPPGIEGHGQALARALSVPDHADTPVSRIASRLTAGLVASGFLAENRGPLQFGRPQSLSNGRANGVELMIPRHLLDQRPAAVIFEHDEVANQRQEPVRVAHTRKHDLQLGQVRLSQNLSRNRAPGLEPLPACSERPDSGLDSVRNDQRCVEGKQRGDFRFVGLELLPSRPHGGILVRRVLEFDQPKRQAVDKQHDIGSALVLVLDYRKLVDR